MLTLILYFIWVSRGKKYRWKNKHICVRNNYILFTYDCCFTRIKTSMIIFFVLSCCFFLSGLLVLFHPIPIIFTTSEGLPSLGYHSQNQLRNIETRLSRSHSNLPPPPCPLPLPTSSTALPEAWRPPAGASQAAQELARVSLLISENLHRWFSKREETDC